MPTTLSAGPLTWNWNENWGEIPQSDGFAHHGLQVRANGEIIVGDTSLPRIHRLDAQGTVIASFDLPVSEVHGLTVASWKGQEVLWVCDIAKKNGQKKKDQGQVIACDFSGKVLAELPASAIPGMGEAWYSPTAIAVDPRSGDLWITDGYGQGAVHCFSEDLAYRFSIDGSEGAGRFNNPHWVHVDTRKEASEIYVADRMSHRIQIFDTTGRFLRSLGEGQFNTPSAIAAMCDHLLVAELHARVAVLDADDEILGFIGDGTDYLSRPGWPNQKTSDEAPAQAPTDLQPGRFNSPHGIAADAAGNIYVSEWLLGGRFIKLEAFCKGGSAPSRLTSHTPTGSGGLAC